MSSRCFVVSLFLATLLTTFATSQSLTSGDITGVVTDPSGAVISGANVSLTNHATDAKETHTSVASKCLLFDRILCWRDPGPNPAARSAVRATLLLQCCTPHYRSAVRGVEYSARAALGSQDAVLQSITSAIMAFTRRVRTRGSMPATLHSLETCLSPRPILASEPSRRYPPPRSRTITA
jgi:hypothetical protein